MWLELLCILAVQSIGLQAQSTTTLMPTTVGNVTITAVPVSNGVVADVSDSGSSSVGGMIGRIATSAIIATTVGSIIIFINVLNRCGLRSKEVRKRQLHNADLIQLRASNSKGLPARSKGMSMKGPAPPKSNSHAEAMLDPADFL